MPQRPSHRRRPVSTALHCAATHSHCPGSALPTSGVYSGVCSPGHIWPLESVAVMGMSSTLKLESRGVNE